MRESSSSESQRRSERESVRYRPEKWEEMRPLIQELHQRANPKMTYEQILEHLSEKCQFYPSLTTLKTKLASWKLPPRNATERTMHEILTSGASQRIGNRVITVDDAKKYMALKAIEDEDIYLLRFDNSPVSDVIHTPSPPQVASDSSSPEGAIVTTPESAGVFYTFSPVSDRTARAAVRLARDALPIPPSPTDIYIDKSTYNLVKSVSEYFGQGLRVWQLGTRDLNIDSQCPSMTFGALFLQFHNEHMMDQYHKAYKTRTLILDQAQSLLTRQDPRLLLYFLEGLAFSRAQGYERLAFEVNYHFMRQARELLGPEHQITVFCDALLQPTKGERDQLVETALECMLQQYLTVLTQPDDLETTNMLLTGAMILKHLQFYSAASKFLSRLFPMYERHYGLNSGQAVQCLIDQSHIHIDQNDLLEAGKLIRTASVLEAGITDPVQAAESKMRILVGHAVLAGVDGHHETKRAALQNARAVGKSYNLDDDHWAMRDARAREIKDFGQLDVRVRIHMAHRG